MRFFDKIKEFSHHISEVENNIYTNKQDFLEIYERNVQLEKDIEERTKELDAANQRMLSLQHIWEMMNSSQPLSSVLEAIVKSLQGELGYLHSCVIKRKEDEDGKYLKIISYAQDELIEKINKILGIPLNTRRLHYSQSGIFDNSLCSNKIIQSVDLRSLMNEIMPDLAEDLKEKILNNAQSRSVILVPLCTREQEFGWLVVFSSRDIATENEINFLGLFAKQIEMAITIAGLFEAVKNQAITDGLTGLYNRRYFEEFLHKEVTRAERMKQPFTLIGLDLDFLKQINDKYGHTIGDLAIKTVASVMKKNARAVDVAARMGGEEFNLLLPGVDSQGGLIAAERLRSAIAECNLEQVGQITASIGVATFFEHTENVDELIELTDQAMYAAKRNGRNQVQIAKPITETSWQEVAINAFMDILSKKRIPLTSDTSEKLFKKLAESAKDNSSPQDMLYGVADMLAKSYNPLHSKGITKLKVRLAKNLAKAFELSKEESDKLRVAILLYDIGNLMLPQELLQKKEPLTKEEKDQIQEHPLIAAREILKPISEIQDVIPIIEHHHENWDGTGYPGKISGDKIPLSSQIILITDAYFALIEQRAYRHALSPQEALAVIKKDSDKKWNPDLVREFTLLIESELNSVKM